MPSIHLNGTKINYLQLPFEGAGPAEDLVMIHGLATNMAYWYMPIAQAFTNRYRVTLYDLRGHGRSGMPETGYDPQNMATDLALLLDYLEIEKSHIVAHSFGAVVALKLALQMPARIASLVLADSHIGQVRRLGGDEYWQFAEPIQRVLDENGFALSTVDPYFGYRLLKEVAKRLLRGEEIPQQLEAIVNPLYSNAGKRTANQWLKLLETTRAEQELMADDELHIERLTSLKFPILAMYGENSQALITGRKLLQIWPHARFYLAKGQGHFFPSSEPYSVINECRTFWRRQRLEPVKTRHCDGIRQNHFRSSRYTVVGEKWFFDTREGQRLGPYRCSSAAARGLYEYIDSLQSISA